MWRHFAAQYDDLKKLFSDVLGKKYTEEAYLQQFSIRVRESLAKVDRILRIYGEDVSDAPKRIFEILEEQKQRLLRAQEEHGDLIPPSKLPAA
jgi:phosphoenolpyruvate carboxykinase (GTP)